MINELENYYLKHNESTNSCLLALRNIILSQDTDVTTTLKYGMPFFCYKQKMFCYLWVHKTLKQPYIGIVEGKHINHPNLILEKRARMKTMLFDSDKDLPIDTIESILQQALNLYKTGIVKI